MANDPLTGDRFEISHADNYKKWEQMLIDKHGNQDLELQRTKVKNLNQDSKQYSKYKKLLDEDNFPKTLDKFQDIKYKDKERWESIKKKYRKML